MENATQSTLPFSSDCPDFPPLDIDQLHEQFNNASAPCLVLDIDEAEDKSKQASNTSTANIKSSVSDYGKQRKRLDDFIEIAKLNKAQLKELDGFSWDKSRIEDFQKAYDKEYRKMLYFSGWYSEKQHNLICTLNDEVRQAYDKAYASIEKAKSKHNKQTFTYERDLQPYEHRNGSKELLKHLENLWLDEKLRPNLTEYRGVILDSLYATGDYTNSSTPRLHLQNLLNYGKHNHVDEVRQNAVASVLAQRKSIATIVE